MKTKETYFDLSVFPNPARSNELHINYHALEQGEVKLSVYNMTGVMLTQKKEMTTTGLQIFTLEITTFQKGNYLLELKDCKRTGTAKFIVH